MPQPTTSLLDELFAASRGFLALLTGNRRAASYFDFSQRGLVGALIALVVSIALQAFGPQLMGMPSGPGVATGATFLGTILMGIQFGIAWIVLRQFGRLDGFTPFVVATSWSAFFEAILLMIVFRVFGMPMEMVETADQGQMLTVGLPLLFLGIMGIVMAVNIARLIVTLAGAQILLFIGAQLLAALIAPFLVGAFL